MMRHYDLTSLGLMADAVVLADPGAARTVEPYVMARSYRIVRVYAGSLTAGATVEAYDGSYALDREPGGFQPAERPFDARVVLFLVRNPASGGRPNGPAYSFVPSGVRALRDGHVFRFEQWSNPGPYVPVPQGHDPEDVRSGATREAPLPLATFERELACALRRAAEIRTALAAPAASVRDRRARLLGFLPPVQDHLAGTGRLAGFYEDAVANRVVASLAAEGVVDGALEAVARTLGLRPWPLRGDAITTEALLARAADATAPRHVRVEALLSVWDPDGARAASVEAVSRLLSDPVEDVRIAAARALGQVGRTSTGDPARTTRTKALARTAVRRAYGTETVDAVRVAVLVAAADLGLRAGLRPPRGVARWALSVRHPPGQLLVEIAAPGDRAPTIAGVTLEPAGCQLEEAAAWNGGRIQRLLCPPGTPTPTRVIVEVTLPNRTSERRTLPLP